VVQDVASQVCIEALAAVVFAVEIPVVVTIAIPAMIVGSSAVVAVPVALEVALAIVTRFHPSCTGVGRTGPVSVVPSVVVACRVPVASYPEIVIARTLGLNSHYTDRRGRADCHTDGDLSEDSSRSQQRQNK
jgi:hypothetical protein